MDDGKGECSSQLWLELVMLCYVWLQKRRRGRIQGAQKWFAEATVETGSTQMNILFCNIRIKKRVPYFVPRSIFVVTIFLHHLAGILMST